jgi:predicted AlkP superfamily pyrophosphatase or phosphodiesterase
LTTLLIAFCLLLTQTPADAAEFDHVIVISVDGLRSDAIPAARPELVPNLLRMLAGSSTLNARTDPDSTVTLPNHTCMLTGRHVLGERGHGWTLNYIDRDHNLLHAEKGEHVSGVFEVANEGGVHTAAFVSKLKLSLYDMSWAGKIDDFDYVSIPEGSRKFVTHHVLKALDAGHDRSLTFVHYREPDSVGHATGWNLTQGSEYLMSIAKVDVELGLIFDKIEQSERLRGRTAVILTADHGGGAPHRSHTRPEMWVNYIIPFLVWTGDDAPTADLYELNERTRRNPGIRRPDADETLQPVRNGDAANLALSLLGLPAIPGSTINAEQDLEIRETKRQRD